MHERLTASKPQAADQHETVVDLLDKSGRTSRAVPIRTLFVQGGAPRRPQPGPLAAIVSAHDVRALDLYLLHRAVASGGAWDVTRGARVWGRALGLADESDGGAAAVSKTWARLERRGLVERERRGRLAQVTSLREDGSRSQYTSPDGSDRDERYFKLPFAYWTAAEAWYRLLGLPAKAMLLIALTQRPIFVLPAERVPAWYGFSADTADRGLRELERAGVLTRRWTYKKAPQAPAGFTQEVLLSLRAPFDRAATKSTAAGRAR